MCSTQGMTRVHHANSDSHGARHVQLACSTRSMTRVQRTKYDSRALTDPSNKLINTRVIGTRECKLSRELYRTYGTAQFKLEARVRVTRACFVAPLEYFSKSCVSVDNCTRISRAIHARLTSPYMHACG